MYEDGMRQTIGHEAAGEVVEVARPGKVRDAWSCSLPAIAARSFSIHGRSVSSWKEVNGGGSGESQGHDRLLVENDGEARCHKY